MVPCDLTRKMVRNERRAEDSPGAVRTIFLVKSQGAILGLHKHFNNKF